MSNKPMRPATPELLEVVTNNDHARGRSSSTVTDDERSGIDWFNGLTEIERGKWLRAAGSAVPADAWAEYKRPRAISTT